MKITIEFREVEREQILIEAAVAHLTANNPGEFARIGCHALLPKVCRMLDEWAVEFVPGGLAVEFTMDEVNLEMIKAIRNRVALADAPIHQRNELVFCLETALRLT